MAILLGFLTTLLTIVFLVILSWTGYLVHTFALFFVIPVGALVAGACCSSGFYWWNYTQKQHASIDALLGMTLGVLGFAGLYTVLYLSANNAQWTSFGDYLLRQVGSRQSNLLFVAKRVPIPTGSISMGLGYNLMKFALEAFGFLGGGFLGFVLFDKGTMHLTTDKKASSVIYLSTDVSVTRCVGCNRTLRLPKNLGDRSVRCPTCRKEFRPVI